MARKFTKRILSIGYLKYELRLSLGLLSILLKQNNVAHILVISLVSLV